MKKGTYKYYTVQNLKPNPWRDKRSKYGIYSYQDFNPGMKVWSVTRPEKFGDEVKEWTQFYTSRGEIPKYLPPNRKGDQAKADPITLLGLVECEPTTNDRLKLEMECSEDTLLHELVSMGKVSMQDLIDAETAVLKRWDEEENK